MSTTAADTIRSFAGPTVRICGARTHNLQDTDVEFPRNQLVVVTGVSGSGKSSLVFDTLLAEGQRQFVDSLSIYARQFFDQMQRADVDRITGLQPTIAIDQHPAPPGPRSTVGTLTEIYDYLRLLYARAGQLCCPECGTAISQQSPEEIGRHIAELPTEARVMILAPLVRGRKGKHADTVDAARKAGFARLRVDGVAYPIDEMPELAATKPHDIDAVVDRVVIREGIESRLAESVRLALKHGDGVLTIVYQTRERRDGPSAAANSDNGWIEMTFSTRFACANCRANLVEVEPRTFSFNSPYGACEACSGLGRIEGFDAALVVSDESRSIDDGAIVALTALPAKRRADVQAKISAFAESAGASTTQPLADWPEQTREELIHGNGRKYAGLLIELEKILATSTSEKVQQRLAEYRGTIACADCRGTRLKPTAGCSLVAGQPIFEFTSKGIDEALDILADAEFATDKRAIAAPIVAEINKRLSFLKRAGLGYLTLDRPTETLSGGEHQRVRLATALGSGLVGVMYLLDEPSMGLHPRDSEKLLAILRDLQRQGTTVVVVEHDESFMRAADWLIDVGPGAGRDGGRVVAEGAPAEVAASPDSLSADYLSGRRRIAVPDSRRVGRKSRQLQLRDATLHNLQSVDFDLPLGLLVAVAGVSGSGKSSLVLDTLARALARKLHRAGKQPGPHASLQGIKHLDRVVRVDQAPIGRSPRSNAASYTGLFDEIRKLMANTKLARQRGYTAGRFSFNVKGGRCEECQGQGAKRIEMRFLPDLFATCPACRGRRFNRQTLAVTYRGKSIADVLDLSVADALEFFSELSGLTRILQALADVGLGYLPIGQPSNTLSGGEAQRIKLAAELGRPASGHTLFVLDEPTTGLHSHNVAQLLDVLHQLVEADNSVLVIEHHPAVLASADWVVELGPNGGTDGGSIIAEGTPEEVAANAESVSAPWITEALASD